MLDAAASPGSAVARTGEKRGSAMERTVWDCSICLSTPEGHVHQCINGHFFCAGCLGGLPRCPECRADQPTTPIRCLAAEQAIKALPAACRHCGEQMTRGERSDHEGVCPEAEVPCDAAGEGCLWTGRRSACAARANHVAGCIHMKCRADILRVKAEWKRSTDIESARLAAAKAEVARLRRDREMAQENLRKIEESLARARLEESAQAGQVAKVREDSERRIQDILEGARRARDGSPTHLNLKVVCSTGHEIYFKCKETTPLAKLMHLWCSRQGKRMGSVRFLFDGNCVNEAATPGGLGMEDGDVIDVIDVIGRV